MNLIKPITPEEVEKGIICHLPDEVINCFNELISRNYSCGFSEVLQEDAVAMISSRLNIERQSVFKNKWLNVERFYMNAGWDVQYDESGYDKTYKACFRFSVKNKS
jgi:hypothetical protein